MAEHPSKSIAPGGNKASSVDNTGEASANVAPSSPQSGAPPMDPPSNQEGVGFVKPPPAKEKPNPLLLEHREESESDWRIDDQGTLYKRSTTTYPNGDVYEGETNNSL